MELPNTAALEINRPKENVEVLFISYTTFDWEKLYFMKPDKRVCLYSFRPTDRYIGYLPLAHIMEMVCGESCKGIEVNLHYQNERYL